MKNTDGDVVATCNQFLLHVSLETRKSCDPAAHVSDKLASIIAAQAALPKPELT